MRQQEKPIAELFLRDFISLLKEKALLARQQRIDAQAKDLDYAVGRLMAFHEVVSLLQQEALAFELDLETLGLNKIDPERDLV